MSLPLLDHCKSLQIPLIALIWNEIDTPTIHNMPFGLARSTSSYCSCLPSHVKLCFFDALNFLVILFYLLHLLFTLFLKFFSQHFIESSPFHSSYSSLCMVFLEIFSLTLERNFWQFLLESFDTIFYSNCSPPPLWNSYYHCNQFIT